MKLRTIAFAAILALLPVGVAGSANAGDTHEVAAAKGAQVKAQIVKDLKAAKAWNDGSITIYRDHNLYGSLYSWVIHPGACNNGASVVAYVLTYERQRASSIKYISPIGDSYCNYLSVRSASWDHPYWGTYVVYPNYWYNFGQGYNDNVDAWVLEHR